MDMKSRSLVFAASLLIASTGLSQRTQEKPKLHSDFYFGTNPTSRDAATTLGNEKVRLLLVGFHNGWDIEKIAKEAKAPEDELERLFADLQDSRFADEIDRFTLRAMLPVIRDKDMKKVQKSLDAHTLEFTNLLRSNWAEIEQGIAPAVAGAKDVPHAQLLYQLVVGGILFGSMNEAFFEDQTIMVNPPRRTGNQRFYAWLVESDPKLAGTLKREQWESDGFTLVSIGTSLQPRISLDRVRAEKGMVLEEADARRLRSFLTIFTKERLLPYFKKNRSSFLNALYDLDAGKYVRVSDAFAWYYDQMANGAVEGLVGARLIQPPASGQYTYALKAPGR
jgi:hypothetical protein